MTLTRFEALGLLPDKLMLNGYVRTAPRDDGSRGLIQWKLPMERLVEEVTERRWRGRDVRLAFELVTLKDRPGLGYLIRVGGPTFKFYLKADIKKCRRFAKRYACKLPSRPTKSPKTPVVLQSNCARG